MQLSPATVSATAAAVALGARSVVAQQYPVYEPNWFCQRYLDFFDVLGLDYADSIGVTGVAPNEMTRDDTQRLLACRSGFGAEVFCPNIGFPANCRSPPCNSCTGGYTPSKVTTDGFEIFVDGVPFHINGVCWSPIPKGSGFGSEAFAEYVDIDVPKMVDAGMNALRTYAPITDLSVLDKLYNYGIKVMMPIAERGGASTAAEIKEYVSQFKNHPAVLAWSLGNEWNLNRFYNKDLTLEECEAWIKMAAAAIKEVDTNHPVVTVYGDAPPDVNTYMESIPEIDIWSLNVYRYDTFRNLYEKWESDAVATGIKKPIILGEFGVDAWNSSTLNSETLTTTGGFQNTTEQGRVTAKLMEEIYTQSTGNPDATVKVSTGGFIFEWADEYWKRGDWNTQDTEGLSPCAGGCGPAPDYAWNEDWWGIAGVSRDYSQCGPTYDPQSPCPLREAYYKYKEAPKPALAPPPMIPLPARG